MTVEDVARVCHEANRAMCQILGDNSHAVWADAPEWQKTSSMRGVRLQLQQPSLIGEDLHRAWMTEKFAAGWRYGEKKDTVTKTHPCLLPYRELPPEQKMKDALFRAIVGALAPLVSPVDIHIPERGSGD